MRREFGRIVRYPIYPTMMIILPMLSFTLVYLLFAKGLPRDIPIAVCDDDRTELSRQVISMIDQTPTPMVAYEIQSVDEGERMIKQGKAQAVVYVPKNFQKDILNNNPTTVAAYINGINISANGLLNKDIQTAVTTFSSGVEIQILMKQGLSEAEAYEQMMPIYFDRHVLFNPYTNYGYFLLPSFMPMMLMIFTLLLTVFCIGSELKNSTSGEWFAAAGGRVSAAIVGKVTPYTAAMFLMFLFMNTIMYKWYGVPLNGNKWVLFLGGLMFIMAYQAIGVMFIAVLSNLRLALSLGGGYSVLAFTYSGLTFPLMAMDWYVRGFSFIFPFTYYTEIFVDQAIRGAPVMYSVKYLGILALFIILPLASLPRLKKVATDSRYWGRM